ncbi:MAG: hypothetical protein IPL32_09190 [Chloracidobacterium sp.]|nr:hypothetical protein [Chloracidobacterium sp.]
MNFKLAAAVIVLLTVFSPFAHGQKTVVVNDPTNTTKQTKLSDEDAVLILRNVLPKVTAKYQRDACNVNIEPAGAIHGAFTRTNSKQTLAFFQICQTGNGFGVAGLALIENKKVIAIFGADAGWTVDIGLVPDVNQNGLNEFILAYSGGMHQGHGGSGVDLMEFSKGSPVGIGWYLAEKFEDTQAMTAWKLTAKPGKSPIYYRQKFNADETEKWRIAGKVSAFKLGKAYSKFDKVK